MQISTLVNGSPSDSISVNNRGFAFADGVFETLKVSSASIEFYDFHLARLKQGCERLKLNCDFSAIEADVKALLARNTLKEAVLKITVTRGFTCRGYAPDKNAGTDRLVSLQECNDDYEMLQSEGITTRLCETRLSENPLLAGIKHIARLENVMASGEWDDPAIHEGLMLSSSGKVISGTKSNVFIVKGECLYAPSLDRCGVKGTIREVVINKLCPVLQMKVIEKDIEIGDLLAAEELFICNSLAGILPVIKFEQHIKAIGPKTVLLQNALRQEVIRHV